MKHKTVNTIRQGKKSGMTITTTFDDEALTKTHNVVMWRGKRKTYEQIVWNTATGKLISINKCPVPTDETMYSKVSYLAAKLISDLAEKGEGANETPADPTL